MPRIKTKTAVAKKKKKVPGKKPTVPPKKKVPQEIYKPIRFFNFINLHFFFDPKLRVSVLHIFRQIQLRITEFRFKLYTVDDLPRRENQLKIMMMLFVPKVNNIFTIFEKYYTGSNVPTVADIDEIVAEIVQQLPRMPT